MIRYQEQIEKTNVQRNSCKELILFCMEINSTEIHNLKWNEYNPSFEMKAHLLGYAFKT